MKLRSNLTIGSSILLPLRGLRRASLLTVLLLAACAPSTVPAPTGPEAPAQPAPPESETASPTPTPAEIQPQAAVTGISPMEAPTEAPQAVATSRGPNLEATDPNTVNLASGDLQLVEFFRFT